MAKKKKQERRSHGEGSIYLMKNGRYGAAVSLGKDENGKRVRPVVTGKTEEEVRRKMEALLKTQGLIETGGPVVLTLLSTVEELVQEFIKNEILMNIAPAHLEWDKMKKGMIHSRTAESYVYLMREKFLNKFRGRVLGSITTEELNQHFKKLAKEYSNSGIEKVHCLVNKMFRRAQRKWTILNPLDSEDFKLPVSDKKDRKVEHFSDNEMQQLLAGVEDCVPLKTIINLSAFLGTRIQEVLNLRWRHIDFESGAIRIERAMTFDVSFDENGNTLSKQTVDGRTKRESSIRTLYIGEYGVQLIKEWRVDAAERTKTKFGADDYVFGNQRGDHYTISGFRAVLDGQLEKKYGKGHGLAAVHRIRHTVATKAAAEGASTIELMHLLGDNQEKSVLRYTGRSKEIGTKNRDRVNKGMMALLKNNETLANSLANGTEVSAAAIE